MNNLTLSFSVIFPLFFMMALGYFLRVIHLFDEVFLKKLNTICFKVFLPLLLFINIYHSDFQKDFSPKLIFFALSCILLAFIVSLILVPLFEKNNTRKGVIIQAIFRSNFVLFGIPIVSTLYGNDNVSTVSILVAFIVPFFNILSVIALELFNGDKINFPKIIKNVFKNPLILASISAFLFILTGIKLPVILEKSIVDTSRIATPLALIVLGGSFILPQLKSNIVPVLISCFCKLVLLPFIFISVSVLFGYREIELISLFVMLATPTAVSSFTMADNIGADSNLAGQIIVMGSIFSIVTIFLGITMLTQLGFV